VCRVSEFNSQYHKGRKKGAEEEGRKGGREAKHHLFYASSETDLRYYQGA
jgi:hypothetical protein